MNGWVPCAASISTRSFSPRPSCATFSPTLGAAAISPASRVPWGTTTAWEQQPRPVPGTLPVLPSRLSCLCSTRAGHVPRLPHRRSALSPCARPVMWRASCSTTRAPHLPTRWHLSSSGNAACPCWAIFPTTRRLRFPAGISASFWPRTCLTSTRSSPAWPRWRRIASTSTRSSRLPRRPRSSAPAAHGPFRPAWMLTNPPPLSPLPATRHFASTTPRSSSFWRTWGPSLPSSLPYTTRTCPREQAGSFWAEATPSCTRASFPPIPPCARPCARHWHRACLRLQSAEGSSTCSNA